MKNKYFFLWLSGIACAIAVLPYVFELQRDALEKVPISLFEIGLIGIAQAAVFLAVAIFLGAKLSKTLGLSVFESKIFSRDGAKQLFKLAVPVGVIVGILIKFSDLILFQNLQHVVAASDRIPFWKVILVAPYGGLVEELLMRLFLVSLFAWLIGKIVRSRDVIHNDVIMWIAIIFAAILFGIGHLPATATVTQITPMVVIRAIVLNGIGGLAFGWLYWKKDLGYSVVAHSTTDIVLLVLLPALLK